jgi:putative transposase
MGNATAPQRADSRSLLILSVMIECERMFCLTFKYRCYPTRAQDASLHAQVDEACRLYNGALQERRDAWKRAHRSVSYYEQANQLKAIRADGSLALANFSACQDVLRRVDTTFRAFFTRVKAGHKAGYPRFKSYRPIDGRVKTVSVKREAGKWYALFSCEAEPSPLPRSDEVVGIDVGLTAFATLSDGSEIANPRHLRAARRKLRLAQRRVARRKRGSRGRHTAVRMLQQAHARVRHQRADFHHKISRALVDRFGLIAVEDLNVKGLAGSMLAGAVHDAGWASFLAKLDYKAESAGRRVVRVNPAGTTQRCSTCGEHVPKTLSQRWHDCPACGLSLSRDENAAREILRLGLSLAEQTWPAAASVSAEAVCLS